MKTNLSSDIFKVIKLCALLERWVSIIGCLLYTAQVQAVQHQSTDMALY